MEMVEITKEAFIKLVPTDTPCSSVEKGEMFYKAFFYVPEIDMTLVSVDNFPSCCKQYFIVGINS